MINTQIPAQLTADLNEHQAAALTEWAKRHAQQAFALGAQKGWDFGLNMDADGFEAMLATTTAAQAQTELMVRYCPGCGSIGTVDAQHSDCCPDGNQARMIPQPLAEKCHDTFQVAIKSMLADVTAGRE